MTTAVEFDLRLDSFAFQCCKLTHQSFVGRICRLYGKGTGINGRERKVKVRIACGDDIFRPNIIAQTVSGISSLVVSDLSPVGASATKSACLATLHLARSKTLLTRHRVVYRIAIFAIYVGSLRQSRYQGRMSTRGGRGLTYTTPTCFRAAEIHPAFHLPAFAVLSTHGGCGTSRTCALQIACQYTITSLGLQAELSPHTFPAPQKVGP